MSTTKRKKVPTREDVESILGTDRYAKPTPPKPPHISIKPPKPPATITTKKKEPATNGVLQPESTVSTFYHAVNSGDLIASMAGMQHHWKTTGKKALIYQKLNLPGNYYPGATHPLVDDSDQKTLVTMNQPMFNMLRPLVTAQPYIEDLLPSSGEKVDYDLHRIHNGMHVNMPWGQIQRWTWYAFPDLACNLANPWIVVPKNDDINVSGINNKYKRKLEDCMILNFSERYRDRMIEYHFLRQYMDRLVFAGTNKEYQLFCKNWGLDIPYLQVNDFLELAQAIRGARCLLGNQSMCFNIAEAMKTPRILEVGASAQNVIPVGEDAYDCLYLGDVEYYVEKLMSTGKRIYLCPVCGEVNQPLMNKRTVDYYQCTNCKTIYSKMLDQSSVQYTPLENYSEIATRVWMLLSTETRLNPHWLDYGCGHGELIAAGANPIVQVTGYDKFVADYSSYPPDKDYDVVTLINVLEHLTYPFTELFQINDSMKTGGYLYVRTMFSDNIPIASDLVDPALGRCTLLSSAAIETVMQAHGFALHNVVDSETRIYRKV